MQAGRRRAQRVKSTGMHAHAARVAMGMQAGGWVMGGWWVGEQAPAHQECMWHAALQVGGGGGAGLAEMRHLGIWLEGMSPSPQSISLSVSLPPHPHPPLPPHPRPHLLLYQPIQPLLKV